MATPQQVLRKTSMSLIEHVAGSNGNPHITLMKYDKTNVEEAEIESFEGFINPPKGKSITWIDVDGIHDLSKLSAMCQVFDVRMNLLEQVTETTLRPKIDDYGDYLHIVLRTMRYQGELKGIVAEQVHLVLGRNFVISIQEGAEGDVFDSVRARIRSNIGGIREKGPDFLIFALLEAVIDHYFLILEDIGELMEDLQEEMLDNPSAELLRQVRDLKKTVRYLRKAVWPLREVINALEQEDTPLIDDRNNLHFRRAYEHTIQAMDAAETTRDVLSDMLDIYLSSTSNKMNVIMKRLTSYTMIFGVCTLIAGIYGMNFDYMPELNWTFGYPLIMGIMLVIASTMFIIFKKQDWL